MDLVKIMLDNIKQEGIVFTLKKAWNKLDMSISLGYTCAGKIIAIGEDVSGFRIGERVACVGEKQAAHCEINNVPSRFAVSIPDDINYLEASFVGLGAIALNAVELSQAREQEVVAVIGLGLIGQAVAQIFKARKCKVIGIDIDEYKLSLAKKLGIDAVANSMHDDINSIITNFSSGAGADIVLIAAASKNHLLIEMAGRIARNRGRVILVGAMPIIIPRKEYYEKELIFMISSGFGSDLYYKEDKDRRYAYNYKSVTTKENMQNFLQLLAKKKIAVGPLVSHKFHISDAAKAYALMKNKAEKYLGIVFEYYIENPSLERKISLRQQSENLPVSIGFIGAGSFAQGYLLPTLKKIKDVRLIGVATNTSINAKNCARKFGFEYCTTDYKEILNDKIINCVFIITRHNLHAEIAIEAIAKGKNVFVEKPLCLSEDELQKIISAYNSDGSAHSLMVGFNRRFSPLIEATKDFFVNRADPFIIQYRINAGILPTNHWIYDPYEGGGRIAGELGHFVDLMQYITEASPVEVFATSSNKLDAPNLINNVSATIKFSDGSVGTIVYCSNGDIAYPRERIEIFGENSVAVIDNFKRADFVRKGMKRAVRVASRDMGYRNEVEYFVAGLIKAGASPITFREIISSTVTTFKVIESLSKGSPVSFDIERWLRK